MSEIISVGSGRPIVRMKCHTMRWDTRRAFRRLYIIYVYADRADSENGEVRKTSFPLSFASSSRRRDALSLRSVVENRSDRQFW